MLRLIRFIAVGVALSFVHLLGFMMCLLRPKNPKNTFWIARGYGFMARLLGIRIHRKISNQVDFSKPAIYIGNHQSNWDIFILTNVVMPKTVAVGKKSLVWLPFFGQLFWLSGNILIDRGNPKKARSVIDKIIEQIQKRKISVWLFPEGTRSKTRGLLPFKTGAFYAAIQAGVPIIPVICQPYLDLLDLNRWRAADIHIEVCNPIDTSKYQANQIRLLVNNCYQLYQEKITEILEKNN